MGGCILRIRQCSAAMAASRLPGDGRGGRDPASSTAAAARRRPAEHARGVRLSSAAPRSPEAAHDRPAQTRALRGGDTPAGTAASTRIGIGRVSTTLQRNKPRAFSISPCPLRHRASTLGRVSRRNSASSRSNACGATRGTYPGTATRERNRLPEGIMDRSEIDQRIKAERRRFLRGAGTLGAGALLGSTALRAVANNSYMLPIGNGERPVVQYPQKRPLIVLTSRPPQLETPFEVFNDGVDHAQRRVLRPLSPRRRARPSIDLDTFRINDQGHGRHAARPVGGRAQGAFEPIEYRRGQPVLGQQPRPVRAARRRRPARQRRDGQCQVARRAAEDRARQGRRADGREAGDVRRPRRAGAARRRPTSPRRSTSITRWTAR